MPNKFSAQSVLHAFAADPPGRIPRIGCVTRVGLRPTEGGDPSSMRTPSFSRPQFGKNAMPQTDHCVWAVVLGLECSALRLFTAEQVLGRIAVTSE